MDLMETMKMLGNETFTEENLKVLVEHPDYQYVMYGLNGIEQLSDVDDIINDWTDPDVALALGIRGAQETTEIPMVVMGIAMGLLIANRKVKEDEVTTR